MVASTVRIPGLPTCLLLLPVALAGLRPAAVHAEDDARTAAPRPTLVAQVGHAERLTAAALSADGQWVLTGSHDGTARLWHAATGREVRRFEGHTRGVTSVAFAPDGRQVLTGSGDGTARLWNTATGQVHMPVLRHQRSVNAVAFSPDGKHALTGSFDKTAALWSIATHERVQTFAGHGESVSAVTFSPDGRHVLTGSLDRTARLWDVATGRAVAQFDGHAAGVSSVAYAPNGTHVLTGSGDKTARLWDIASRRTVQAYAGHTAWVQGVAFSPDGWLVTTASDDGTARLFDARSAREIQRFTGHGDKVVAVCFARDGQHVLTASEDRTARLWRRGEAAAVRTFQGRANDVLSVAFSSDGQQILTGSTEGVARRWDAVSGKDVERFAGHVGQITAVAFSPDCRLVLTGAEDMTARLWDARSAALIRPLVGHEACVCSATFSPDGASVLTASKDGTARLWNAASGNLILRLDNHTLSVNAAVFSPDGARVLTGSEDETARLWETATGTELRVFTGHRDRVEAVAFSPDGSHVLTGSRDRTARLWRIDGKEPVQTFEGHRSSVSSVAFVRGGAQVLTGSWDGTVRLWDTATGQEQGAFSGHTSRVTALCLSPDGTRVLSGSLDGSARVWDVATGRPVCTLMSFRDGTWAVADPAGRFDASNGGDIDGLHWVVGLEVISLDQLKARYYEPGLLAKLFGHNPEPIRHVEAFMAPKLYPGLQVTQSDGRLRIELDDQGGGIGEVVILVNGKERTADARGTQAGTSATHLTIEEDLTDDPRLLPGQKNRIEVFARNAEGYLRSRGAVAEYETDEEGEVPAPALHAVVAGVSDYRGTALDLQYAAADAKAFAEALTIAGEALFGAAHTHVQVLVDARRESLVEALTAARSARASDVLVIYLAGHGLNVGEDFHFLTAEAESADLGDPAVRQASTLSHNELITAINAIPALKQVLILDTCASGAVINALAGQRAVPSSQVRALERVKDRTGMFVLAGCAADRVSFEDARFGQGLLTYSLLMGMKGGELGPGGVVEVAPLFQFAADRVRELAADIGSVQEPSVSSPRGGTSFPIGILSAQGRAGIQFKATRPVFVRSMLFQPDEGADVLDLGHQVDEVLRGEAARGAEAAFVFMDSAAYAGAYQVSGSYTTSDGTTRVRFRLRSDQVFVTEWLDVEAPTAAAPDRIVEEARRAVFALRR